MKPTKLHSLQRTSPKGGPFVGVCTLCDKSGLTFKDMQEECANTRGLTQDAALIEAIRGTT